MILVTGGAGLLGTALIKLLLEQGEPLRVIYHTTRPVAAEHPLINLVQADILDVIALEEAMNGITHIFHCAGFVSFAPADAQQLYRINVEGTANIVNAALEANVKKIVHVSSVAALGRIREGQTINESMQWTPETSNSKYGHSKYLGEMEVWRGVAEGLEAIVVNPVIILGEGNWDKGSTKIFKSAYEAFPYYTGGITGFVDARDVAMAMVMLMNSSITDERFILSAENKSYHALFNMIAKAFGTKPPSKKVTPFMAGLFWRIQKFKSRFSGNKPLVTKETTRSALAKVYFDNSKLLKALPGFQYRPLENTVADTCVALQQKINKH